MTPHCFQSGFTLIKLMTVVAVIGILSAIAIPDAIRARWSDNIQSLGQVKKAAGECMQNRGQVNPAPPCDAIGAGLGTSNDLIGTGFLVANFVPTASFGTVTMTAGGVIEIVGTFQAGNCTVTMTPLVEATRSRGPLQIARPAAVEPGLA